MYSYACLPRRGERRERHCTSRSDDRFYKYIGMIKIEGGKCVEKRKRKGGRKRKKEETYRSLQREARKIGARNVVAARDSSCLRAVAVVAGILRDFKTDAWSENQASPQRSRATRVLCDTNIARTMRFLELPEIQSSV